MRKTLGLVLAGALTMACGFGAQAADRPAAAKDRTVALTRVVYRIDDGDIWGHINCAEQNKTLRWDRETSEVDAEHLSEVFARVLRGESNATEKVENLFDDQPAEAELQIAAAITEIHAGLCPGYGDASGSLSMTVQWQVFDPGKHEVVARIETRGNAYLGNATGGLDYLFKAAFQANARDLTSDPTFQRTLKATGGPRPDPSPAIHFNATPPGAARTPPAAVRSVVLVRTGGGHGSGFLISTDGYILTNRHVVGSSPTVRIHWADGSETTGTVIRVDRGRDIALVKTEVHDAAPLQLHRGLPSQGDTVFAIGAPMDPRLQGTLTKGIVSATRLFNGQEYIQSDVSVTHGNSGGPLLNDRGEVIGVTVSTANPDGSFLGLNMFIPIDEALRALSLEPKVATTLPQRASTTSRHPAGHR